jgi:uncharacterized protein YbaA (DUF1428 family)
MILGDPSMPARYVDGYVLPVPKKNVASYVRMAKLASKVWLDHGALRFRECRGEDFKTQMGVAFPKLAKMKPGETVFFSWVEYKSRKHRDQVNKKVMKDPRIAKMIEGKTMPFDAKRMAYAGFEVAVAVDA